MYQHYTWNVACSKEKLHQLLHDPRYDQGINGWEVKRSENDSESWEENSSLLENCKCQALSLGNNRLNELIFTRSLRQQSTIKYLDLCYNDIGDKGAKNIAHALKANTTLESLYLFANKIGDVGAKAIASMLKVNRTLKRLDLFRNFIGNKGARAFSNAMKGNSTIVYLNLKANHIYSLTDLSRLSLYLKRNGKIRRSTENLVKLAHSMKLIYIKGKCNEAFLELFLQIYQPGRSGALRLEKHFWELATLQSALAVA